MKAIRSAKRAELTARVRPRDWMLVLEARLREINLPEEKESLARQLMMAIWAIEDAGIGGGPPTKKLADAVRNWHAAWDKRVFLKPERVVSLVEYLEQEQGLSRTRLESRTMKAGPTSLSRAASHFGISESTVARMLVKLGR